MLEREEFKRQHSLTTNSLFTFEMEERYQCNVTNQVKYVTGQQTRQNILEIRIPVDIVEEGSSGNLTEEKAETLKRQKLSNGDKENTSPQLSFDACLDRYFQSSEVDMLNPSLGSQTLATKTISFSAFPKYLMVKLGRYVCLL